MLCSLKASTVFFFQELMSSSLGNGSTNRSNSVVQCPYSDVRFFQLVVAKLCSSKLQMLTPPPEIIQHGSVIIYFLLSKMVLSIVTYTILSNSNCYLCHCFILFS